MRGRAIVIAFACALVLAAPAGAKEKPKEPQWRLDVATAAKGLDAAEARGRLTADETARYRAALGAAERAIESYYPGRAAIVEAVLGDVARGAALLNAPRALTLFGELETNVDYLASRAIPPNGRDIQSADGAVYRVFGGALRFHPLANAAKLNAFLAGKRDEQAVALADALVARGVPNGAGDLWEYWFTFHNLSPPWTSGMAQAVLAQSLAKAGARFLDTRYTEAARRAFTAGRLLVQPIEEGPWVKLYSELGLVVLNAHLQAALSIADYATVAADTEAEAFAAELRTTAAAALPRFDTGAWSLYSLGSEATLDYHRYVVSLLKRLAVTTGEQAWRDAAGRFERYELEPPLVNLGAPPPALYPQPRDGHRDDAAIRIWVSKRGVAVFDTGRRQPVARGWNTIRWSPPENASPGLYQPLLTVTSLDGNETVVDVPPIEVRRDDEPPRANVRASGRKLTWRVVDEGTGRVRVVIAPGARRPVDLGWQPLSRTVRLRLPVRRGTVVRVVDAAGNRTDVRA